MNERDKLANRQANRHLFKQGSPLNCVRLNPNNTFGHEVTKTHLGYLALKKCHAFLTEAEFEHPQKGRADFVDLDAGEIVEILATESEEEALTKVSRYPLPIKTVKAFEVRLKQTETLK